jgi:hypothetical protein
MEAQNEDYNVNVIRSVWRRLSCAKRFPLKSLQSFRNHKTRTATGRTETVLVKRSLRAGVVWISIAMLITATDVVKAGPFRDFFRELRSAIAHPNEKPRPHRSSHRSSHKHNETPPSDASSSQTSGSPVPAPPGGREVRVAKAASAANQSITELVYGTAVPDKPGLVISPFAPDGGYVDVTGFPQGTAVEDPYTGKIFLTP